MPSKFVEGVYPIYLEEGKGCYVSDGNSHWFIDYPLALGAILLGHCYPDVTEKLKIQLLHKGNIFTLPSYLETELAEKLHRLVPSCEQVRFLKTGSEAVSAAVKIARAYTGRERIACCGYHGWHDWFTVTTPKNKGIPECYKGLIDKFEYNNIEMFKELLKRNYKEYAAIILEPCIFEEPKDGFLKELTKKAHKYGSLVIFDEVVTGFRFPGSSAQKFYKVVPDITCLGKAMGNGYSISAVCGKREFMQVLEGDCFVSSTFGGELLGIVAALATIKVLEEEPVIDHIWELGDYLKAGYNEIAKDLDLDTKCIGYPNRTMHLFPTAEHKSLFWQECLKRGVFFGYAQFICFSHKQADIDYTLDVIKDALRIVKNDWKNPVRILEGKPAEEVFRLVAQRS